MFATSSCSPFLPQSRLDQYPSPASLDLKEEGVGIGDQVVRACLDEKPVSQLRFEEDSVEENVLPSLAEAGTKYKSSLLKPTFLTSPPFQSALACMLQNGTCHAPPKRAAKEVLS